ncbi:MAG: hypothetical protein RLZZ214_1121 [Verrucomicrobiota bacterium]|jgi:hypothetical protein
MKVPVLLVCAALAFQAARAEVLSDADREALLENLEKLKESVESKRDAKFRLAIAAYRNAVASDDAAIDLYLNCMEKVNFEDQQKKPADFRDWKRKEGEKLTDPGLRLALRHQLRWLILTLQASVENADRAKLAVDAQEIVDAIFRDPEKLQNQEKTLAQPVTSSVFARAYEINGVMVEKWPLSPIQLDQIYTDVLLPPFQKPGRTDDLRAAWIRRIQQEGAKVEFWNEKPREGKGDGKNEEKRIGMASAMRPPDYERFLQDTVPKLQWEMEVDLFRNGDEAGAALRMLAHLEKYVTHPSIRDWAKEFRELLSPPGAAAAPETTAP